VFDINTPCFGNFGIILKKISPNFICNRIQWTGKIHALGTQKQSQCHEKTGDGDKINNEQEQLKVKNQEIERVSPDKRKTDEKNNLFPQCHWAGPVFPNFG